MGITFKSHEFNRVLEIEEVHDLSLSDARRFNAELVIALSGMDEAIERASRIEKEGGLPFDPNWMHKTLKKRRITLAFADELKRRLNRLEQASCENISEYRHSQYETFYLETLRAMLRDELEPGVLEEIEEEAHEQAKERFGAWLTEEAASRGLRLEDLQQPLAVASATGLNRLDNT